MKTIRMLAAAAALTLSFAAADAARAATVMHDNQGNVVVDAAPGETNNMSVQAGSSGGTVVLLDSGGAPLQAWDDGCEQVMDSMVECATSGYVELWLDDGNDRASVDIFLPANRVVLMHGEGGDDNLSGAPGVSGLDGGPGNDKVTGGEGRDSLYGGDGNDELKGLGGRDELYGQAGDDIVSGDSHKAPAADIIDGGPGIDRIDQDWNDLSGSLVTLTLGGGGDDGRPGEGDDVRGVEKVISFNPVAYAGTDAADHIEVVQVDRPSTLAGGAGDDFLKTSDGADRLDGGPGADTLDGGYNDDTIIGGPGPDRIAGDHPTGECGIYWCKLPAGNDTIEARDGEKDSITCGFGTDTVNADPIDTVARDCETVNGGGGKGRGDDGKGGGSGGLAVKAGRTKLRAALAKGLRVRVTAPGAGKLRATATAKRKQVAAGSRSAKSAGKTTVTLRFSARAKRSLRRAKRAKLKIAVRFTPRNGAATTTTTKVTLTR